MRTLSRFHISRQIIGRKLNLKQNISVVKKKTGLGQIQTQTQVQKSLEHDCKTLACRKNKNSKPFKPTKPITKNLNKILSGKLTSSRNKAQ